MTNAPEQTPVPTDVAEKDAEGAAKAPLRSAAMIASIADPGIPTTSAPFGHALNELAAKDQRIVGLTADLGKYTDMHIFAKQNPDRYFEMGMAEQVMMMAAAGMAEVGLVPFVSTYSVFATRRAYDFMCLDMAEPNLNVNMVCALPGLTTGYGPSHQATEDVAILRGMPNLTILDPCDAVDIEQLVPAVAAAPGPSYTRLLRGKVPRVLDEYDYSFELGKAKVVRPGRDVVLVSSGLMTMRALLAAKELEKHHVDAAVVHCATLKPFDEETVVREVDTDRVAFTLENHTVVGGLFEATASALVKRGIGRQVHPIGLPDEFIDAGALPTLHERYGLSTDAVVRRVLQEAKQ
ncbi:transketolase family protein [Luteococcus peritonei]|uniref:Transketolase family protein n=1 Tax=Luteococcus peritonei TaxID=88874 RepID=A0ABW4RY74_9ACTN